MVARKLRIVIGTAVVAFAVAGLAAVLSPSPATADHDMVGQDWLEKANSAANTYRVVVHVDDFEYTGKWWLSMKNINNLRQELGGNGLAMELVVDGTGVKMLTKDNFEMAGMLEEYVNSGIRLVVGEDAIDAAGIERGRVLPFVTIVASSAAEITERRTEHWAYLKP